MATLSRVIILALVLHQTHSQSVTCNGDCECPSSASGTTCTLNCIGKEQCKDATLQCREGDPCVVKCDGKGSCEGNTRIDGHAATDVTVSCSGEEACKGNTRILCGSKHCDIFCASSTSCTDTRVDTADTWKLSCSGSCASIQAPFARPTSMPTVSPTLQPSLQPTTPTLAPSTSPTLRPSASPTKSPTVEPTLIPTRVPSLSPMTTSPTAPTASQAVIESNVSGTPNSILLAAVTILLICCCAMAALFCWVYHKHQIPQKHVVEMTPTLTPDGHTEMIAEIVHGVQPLTLEECETDGVLPQEYETGKPRTSTSGGLYSMVLCETADVHDERDTPPLLQ